MCRNIFTTTLNTCNQKDIEQTTIPVITVECGWIKHISNKTVMQQHVRQVIVGVINVIK